MSAVAFIQGASRGLGLEFARALSSRGNVKVIAGCRDPDTASNLQAELSTVTGFQFSHPNPCELVRMYIIDGKMEAR